MKLVIDAGSYSIQLCLADDKGNIIDKESFAHHNQVKKKFIQAFLDMLQRNDIKKEEKISISTLGTMSHLLNLPKTHIKDEESAIEDGVEIVFPKAQSIILLGAQRTGYFERTEKNTWNVRRNSNCSAGTGAFFEEQATRLQIPLEEISKEVKKATKIPQIAGRCSVFSKTDMIHHMQEGVTTPDILNGLCYALVRNYKSNIMHNQSISKPVYLAGGVMKNEGVLRAIKDLLNLSDGDYILDESSAYLASFGALKYTVGEYQIDEIIECVQKEIHTKEYSVLPPLYRFKEDTDLPDFTLTPLISGEETFLGIDIGSTSINFVLLNKNREVVFYSYVKTLGKPLDIVNAEMIKLKTKLPNVNIHKIAVTGSGREYIGQAIGADLVINEISAQTEGAIMHSADCDTIFEIGGQDSKYMCVENGKLLDFEMNKVCAAGTGAFLEEQIKKMGVSMEEFLDYAMRAEHPCELGNRCTVYIEGSVNRAIAEGHPIEDVCAGLAYAIATNYLYRVVNQKKIGEKIAVQGGIAYNQAVVCAFRAISGKQVKVSHYFAVTGAMGAASLCMKEQKLTFNKEKNRFFNQEIVKASEASYLGDYQQPKKREGKKLVGVPRVIFLHKMFPLFYKLFTELGFDVLLSPLSDREIVAKSQEYVTAETCYPIKLIYGHIAWLLEQNVDYIVLPRLYTIKHEGSVARKDYACMYMQTSPLIMEQAFHLKERGVTLISPQLSLQFGKKYMVQSIVSIADEIGVPKIKMIPAAIKGFANLMAHSNRLEKIGKGALDGDEPVFVLISRAYNITDPVLNMGIEEHLNKLGCKIVHLEHLEAGYMNIEHDYKDMYWPFGQHILTGLKIIKTHKNLYPIYITNHGCGPDTAIQHFFQNEMEGREYLQLEVDEHSSKVGIITRLEAFLYSLQPQQTLSIKKKQEIEFETDIALLPDFGIYTDVIEKYLPKQYKEVIKVAPLKEHHSFNYAMNKEYYSHLVMLEELLQTVSKDKIYDLYFPIDEGSEVFGQYALLCQQELHRRGYHIHLKTFYIEDIIKRNDYKEIFDDMLLVEKRAYDQQDNKTTMVLGEPLCLYKSFINRQSGICMPFSEALLFHMQMIDRKHHYKKKLSVWEMKHDCAMKEVEGSDLYTSMKLLHDITKGKLDLCVGNSAKYRFAKLLCLGRKFTDNAIILNSAEENVAIILKTLAETYQKDLHVKVKYMNLDFDHQEG